MQNLEKHRKEIFKDETSTGNEGVIAESIKVVNDKFKLNEEQMIQAPEYLYNIKETFLSKTSKVSSKKIWNELPLKL